MNAQKGDFISFSFNDVHSSELGIIRTSDGSRFNENLLPTIQDKTVQVPGGDGTYFFGSYYTQKPFNIPIAFDNLTEEQVRRLSTHFGDKGIHELIFDEKPYKVYMAKVTGTPQIKTICFEEDYFDEKANKFKTRRIYKGEGALNFTCYYPYAKSRFKYLDDFSELTMKVKENGIEVEYKLDKFYGNLDEWAATSGMKNNTKDKNNAEDGDYDSYDKEGKCFTVFNGGDLETDFKFYLDLAESPQGTITLKKEKTLISQLNFSKLEKQKNDVYVCYNSKTNLLEGCDRDFNPTGTLYNKHITGGDFFKIPFGEYEIGAPAGSTGIEYNYLYY